MDNNRIIELLARKQANEATVHELEELRELLTSLPDALYFDEVVAEIWAQKEEMTGMDEHELDAFYQAHELKFREELGFNSENSKTDLDPTSSKVISAQTPISSPTTRTELIPEGKVVKLGTWFKTHIALFGVACGICIIAMASFFYLKNNNSEFDTQVFSGKGTRKKILLPDGTLVWLNAESSLSYDSHLNEKAQRLVYLVGEAFFDVAHHRNKPFLVQTKQLSVKVLGTAFNVKAYAKDEATEATLLRGSIELSMNDQPAKKVILKPSEKFATAKQQKYELNKNGNQETDVPLDLIVDPVVPLHIAGSDYIEETSWKDNILVFQNESLQDLKPRLERWFNVSIELGPNIPKSYRFTGVLKNENIKEALTAMQLIKPFHFKLKTDDVIIY
ncbi:FecR family protein [Pedobacter gandavensis]|uniref:FecR family protein n=1 Tax=Pedobacter gandavensis TaxID=2679963 RepID=UPI002930FB42|nr:FecR domain-containing protein [Pedobacter gandavensis]